MTTRTSPANRDDRLRKSFNFFDANTNGFLEYDDTVAMSARITRAFNEPPDSDKGKAISNGFEVFWQALLNGLDLDGDRRISPDEYMQGMVTEFADTDGGFDRGMRPMVAAILAIGDTDNDGVLDREEFCRLEEAIGNPTSDCDEAFDILDRDHSGTLTVEELTDAAREFHTGTDPNAPGNWLFGSV